MVSRELTVPPKLEEDEPTERLNMNAPASWLAWVHAYRGTHKKPPTLSAAIRELVEYALIAKGVKKPDSTP